MVKIISKLEIISIPIRFYRKRMFLQENIRKNVIYVIMHARGCLVRGLEFPKILQSSNEGASFHCSNENNCHFVVDKFILRVKA